MCSALGTMPLTTPCSSVRGVSCLIQQERYGKPSCKQERYEESGLKQQWRSDDDGSGGGGDDDDLQLLGALPKSCWELILLKRTDRKARRALRLTCKLFRQVIESSMTCLKLYAFRCNSNTCLDKLLKRMHYMDCLRTVILVNPAQIALKHLPGSVTTVKLLGNFINATLVVMQQLATLPRLTSLYIEGINCDLMGMESLSRLTRLCIDCPIGSLAHLAPTLKQLSIQDYNHVQDMDQLTNLEVLDMYQTLPTNFFEEHSRVPIKHLSLRPMSREKFVAETHAWNLAPVTLSHLTLHVDCQRIPPDVLPASITHLQLLHPTESQIKKAAKALPHLRRLDLHLHDIPEHWKFTMAPGCLCGYENLQHLCVHVNSRSITPCRARNHVLKLPDVAMAVHRGLQLSVTASEGKLSEVWPDPIPMQSAWVNHA